MSVVTEFWRRNVLRILIAYLAVGWALTQIAQTVFPRMGLPEAAVTFLVALLTIGLPFALIFAWSFELRLKGVRSEEIIKSEGAAARETGRRLDKIIILTLGLAALVWVIDDFVLSEDNIEATQSLFQTVPEEPETKTEAQTKSGGGS